MTIRTLKSMFNPGSITIIGQGKGHDHRLGHSRCSLDGAELAKRNPGSSWPKQ